MGITNGIATIPGFVTPSVVGAFTAGKVRNNTRSSLGGYATKEFGFGYIVDL